MWYLANKQFLVACNPHTLSAVWLLLFYLESINCNRWPESSSFEPNIFVLGQYWLVV